MDWKFILSTILFMSGFFLLMSTVVKKPKLQVTAELVGMIAFSELLFGAGIFGFFKSIEGIADSELKLIACFFCLLDVFAMLLGYLWGVGCQMYQVKDTLTKRDDLFIRLYGMLTFLMWIITVLVWHIYYVENFEPSVGATLVITVYAAVVGLAFGRRFFKPVTALLVGSVIVSSLIGVIFQLQGSLLYTFYFPYSAMIAFTGVLVGLIPFNFFTAIKLSRKNRFSADLDLIDLFNKSPV